MPQSVLYLAPDLVGLQSGIARYCRMVCRALLSEGMLLTVVARADPLESNVACAEPGMVYWPCGGEVKILLRRALNAAVRGQQAFVLVGHVNFVPLGWLLARVAGARMVTFLYGIDVFRRLSPWHRWALLRSDLIISISNFTARQAARTNGVPMPKVRILNNCIDPSFELPSRSPHTPHRLSLLTVGRMSLAERYKGQDKVIRSMPALLRKFPELVYDVVGDGDWRPALAELAQKLGVAGSVRFHGLVSEVELRRRYSEATIFIMPSRAEGFGFVFLEAMVHGLAVIAGDLDASVEVVVDGETGCLVDPTSVEAITSAAARLLSDGELRRQMGEKGRLRVLEKYGSVSFQTSLAAYLGELRSQSRITGHRVSPSHSPGRE